MTFMNRKLDREIETIFMMTGLRWFFVNSKIIKSAVKAGACVEGLVPDIVCEKLQEKLNSKKAIGAATHETCKTHGNDQALAHPGR